MKFRLSTLVHDLAKSEVNVLKRCAHFFRVLGQPLVAAQVYEKLGDTSSTVTLYVECKQWEMVKPSGILIYNFMYSIIIIGI